MNQILGRILGEKNNRKLTKRHKKAKKYQPSFGISVAKYFVRKGEGPLYDLVAHHQEGNQSPWKLAREEENL